MRQKYDANLIVIGAGDPMAEFTLAMLHGLGMNKILGTLHVYPTWMEANMKIPNMQKILGDAMRLRYGQEPALYWYRDNFVEMKWSYFDTNNEEFLSVRANPNDC